MSLLIGKRFFELATRVAENAAQNDTGGAILVRGNVVLNASHNKNAYARFGEFRRRDKGDAHAELGCFGLDRSVTRGAMYM